MLFVVGGVRWDASSTAARRCLTFKIQQRGISATIYFYFYTVTPNKFPQHNTCRFCASGPRVFRPQWSYWGFELKVKKRLVQSFCSFSKIQCLVCKNIGYKLRYDIALNMHTSSKGLKTQVTLFLLLFFWNPNVVRHRTCFLFFCRVILFVSHGHL